jgi:hypothetical protein
MNHSTFLRNVDVRGFSKQWSVTVFARHFVLSLLTLTAVLGYSQEKSNFNNRNISLSANKSVSNQPEIDPEVERMLHYYAEKIYFTANKGQSPDEVLYSASFPLGKATIMRDGVVMATYDRKDIEASSAQSIRMEQAMAEGRSFDETPVVVNAHAWKMMFANQSANARIFAKGEHSDKLNYFKGDVSLTDISSFEEIWYQDVYPGIDVRYYPAADGSLEYDIICNNGSNSSDIQIVLNGVEGLQVNAAGALVVSTSIGQMSLPAPVAYQMDGDKKVFVDAQYKITSKNSFEFELGKYDSTKPLVIDPIALRWATWVNSNSAAFNGTDGHNHGHGIWVDPDDGAIYVVARVDGQTNNITLGAFDTTPNGEVDLIVGKYYQPAAVGGAGVRAWQTYVGGSSDDNPYACEMGPDGSLYITGYTGSTNMPLIGGSAFGATGGIDNRSQSGDDIFVLKISQDGNSIKNAVIGGDGTDSSYDLRILDSGDIIVCGSTTSDNLNTLHPGLGAGTSNNTDAILFRINSNLTTLSYIRVFGGSGTDVATIMNVNESANDMYIGGYTTSSNFPVQSARENTLGGDRSGFLQKRKLNANVAWSSYFRSASSKETSILCMEFNTAKNRLYFGGITEGLSTSSPSNMPAGGYDTSYNGGTNDFFVTCMDTSQTLIASTYIGGSSNEVNMMGLNVDLNDDVYVFGYSNSTNFPVTSDALQSLLNTNGNTSSNNDKVFLKIGSSLSGSMLYSTYYGGTSDDYDPVGERGIKFSDCRIYTIVTGKSNNMPLTEGAITTNKQSSTSIYEPGLVVWANPPDLTNNVITGNQTICAGVQPNGITGSVPSNLLPNISRNQVITAYPNVIPPASASYTWQWSTDGNTWVNIPGGTSQNLPGNLIGILNETTYFRRIIGGDACILPDAADQIVTVTVLNVPAVVNDVSCFGLNDGSIIATPAGTAPYTYLWNTGSTDQSITNLAPGNYSVHVEDSAGCEADAQFTIDEPSLLTATISSTTTNCNATTGSATVVPSGGTPTYSYLWSNGATTATALNLGAGAYSVLVTDANGCEINKQTSVANISNLSGQIVSITNVTCNNGSDGIAVVTGVNGSLPYTYSIDGSPFSSDNSFEGLSAGLYNVVVKDNTGCTFNIPVEITEPEATAICPADIEIQCGVDPIPSVTGDPSTTCDPNWTYEDLDCPDGFTDNEGQICFEGSNNPIGATSYYVIDYDVNNTTGTVTIRTTLSRNFVDNTYGTNKIGWPGNHTFNNLTGSDQLQLALYDANNVKKLEFKMDYLTASGSAPSGYKSLGVGGGDGSMLVGSASNVLNVVTSLDVNFNQFGYVLTTNSPATDASYTPNVAYPNWIFDVWYECTIDLAAFGAAGFGTVGITGVHASPSKTGNNTEPVTVVDCPDPCEDYENDVCSTTIYRVWTSSTTGLSCTQQIHLVDTTDPVFTSCPQGADLGCNPNGVPAAGQAIATDNCGTPTITSALGNITENGCYRSQTRTYTATDACGNTSTCDQVFTWTVDTTDPVFTSCPQGGDLGCNPNGVPAAGQAIATDNCGTPTITSALGNITENGCYRSQTRTYTATDACGNTSTCDQVFTWTVDTTDPVFTSCPQGGDLGCNPNGVPAAGQAIATDNCGTPTITSALGNIIENGCYRSQTRTYTATDACGNTSTCEQVFTWTVDTTDPVFTSCPQGADLGCNPNGVPAAGQAIATDNCGTPTITSALGNITENGCYRSQTRTYTATDACGNTSTCDQVFTWTVDTTDPVFTSCPQGADLGCNPNGVPAAGQAIATDNCGTPTITSALGNIIENGCYRSQTRTYTATDACGNTSTCEQVFTWTVDATDPVFTSCPQGADLGCNPNGVPAAGQAIATDNCGTPTITSALGNITENGCYRSQTRTYTATDACGNTATCDQVYTWTVDTTDPVFTSCPQGADLGCNPNGVPAAGQAIATDNCGTPTITSALGNITENGCYRSQTRTYTATDACGNTSTCEQVFTWTVDTTDPVFTSCPQGADLGCNPNGVPAAGQAIATDNCGTPTITSALGNITENGCYRSQTRTYTATDACGNTSTCDQVFTWTVDTTDPVFTSCPQGADLGCNPNGVPAAGQAIATDNCGTPTITSALGNITENGCYRSQTRTYTATDACGNTSTCEQVFTWTVDTTDPVFTSCPQGADLGCNPNGVPAAGQAIATDNCGTPTITSALGNITENGCYRSQTRTYTATDACGNTATCDQVYTWTVDTTDPVFTSCPQGADLGCNPNGVPAAGQAIATDNCGTPTITSALGNITENGCYRSQTRTYTATDACGNTSTCDQVFIWKVDHEDPTFVDCPSPTAPATYTCIDDVPAPADVKAFDNCDGEITPVFSETQSNPGSSCQNTIVRTWTATDDCGNSATCVQTIYVNDNIKPELQNVPADITGACGDIPAPSVVTATDNCDNNVFVDYDEEVLSEGCPATVKRTWTAYDDCGNTDTAIQIISYNDEIDPVFTVCPEGGDLGCNPEEIPAAGGAEATDNCGIPVITSLPGDVIANGCSRSFTRTYIATDACGNTATCSQVFTWTVDTTDPVFTSCPQGGDLGCNPILFPGPGQAIATDNCGTPTITSALGNVVEDGCFRSQTRTYTATDACGNTSTCDQVFTWTVDTTDPVFTSCPESVDLGCNPSGIPAAGQAIATDNCGNPTITSALGGITVNGCFRSQTRTYTATDACGNTSTCDQVFTWKVDHEDPTFVDCPSPTAPATYTCIDDVPAPADVKAFDNCDGEITPVFSETQSNPGSSCQNTIVRTWTATDDCGNSATCVQTIYVNDNIKPELQNVPADITGACGDIPAPSVVTATDNCDNNVFVDYDEEVLSEGCPATVKRTWTAYDDCGNTDTAIQIISYNDEIDPVFTVCPEGGDLGCNPEEIPAAGGAEATDNCGIPVITSLPGDVIANGCSRSFTRTYIATDACGNTATCSQVFTWTVDTTDPVFTSCPQGGDLGCNPILFPGPGQAIATDNCGTPTITSALGNIIENGCYRSQTRTYTATDACGNTATCDQVYTWTVDTTDPVFTSCPESVDLGCNPSGIPAAGQAIATDNCGNPTITSALGGITVNGCFRSQTRTYTATDACGNTSTCDQVFTWKVDHEDPTFVDCPSPTAPATYTCIDDVPAPADVKAFDNCDGEITPVFSETQSNPGSSCQNTIVRTWTATDDCGNSATCVQTIYVNDNIKPELQNVPADITGACGDIPAPSVVTATDNCDNNVFVDYNEVIISEGCPATVERTWIAYDDCGNSVSATQVITYDDNEYPVLVGLPEEEIAVSCYSEVPEIANVTATDNCAFDLDVEFDETESNEGSSCNNLITRTWSVTDLCGNTTTFQQYISINDEIDPILENLPNEIEIVECYNDVPAIADVAATDNCDTDMTVNFDETESNPGSSCDNTITRYWSVSDDCGNVAEFTQTIYVDDNTAPVMSGLPVDLIEVSCYNDVPATAAVTAEDNCEGFVTVNYDEQESNPGSSCNNYITREWWVEDACGNYDSYIQTILVNDNEGPISLTGSEEIYIECGDAIPVFYPMWVDNCDLVLDSSAISGIGFEDCGQIISQAYYAMDECGNESSISRVIHITDNTPPTVTTSVADQFIQCNGEIDWSEPTFDDVCDDDLTIISAIDTTELAQGLVITRYFTAMDDCGNSVTDTSVIVIAITEEPILIGLPEQSVVIECGQLEEPAIVFGTDYCGNELNVDFEEDSLVNGCLLTVTRVWTVTDGDGNSTSFTQTIQVGDTTPPTIVCPDNYTVSCADDVSPADIYSVMADDNCAIDTILVQEYTSNFECANRYHVHRIYTAYDECGNSASCEQIIFVYDETAPEFTYVPQGSAGCSEVIEFGMAEATDNCGGEVIITWEDITNTSNDTTGCQYFTYSKGGWGSPSVSEPGSYRDANFDSAFPDGLVIGCNIGSYTFTSALAIKNFLPSGGGASVLPAGNTVNPTAGNTSNNFADQLVAATLNVGFDAYDPSFAEATGNLGDLQFASGVFAGMTANEVIQIANDVIGGCSNAYTPVALLEAMEDINLSFHEGNTISGDLECGDGGEQNVCEYSVTRIWTAEDECGNTSTATTVISVSDTEDPEVVYAPADVHVQCYTDIVIEEPEFTDNCDDELTITPASSIVMTEPCGFLIHKSWTATDNCGNATTVTQNITVLDTIAPTLYGVPNDVQAECGQLPPVADVQAFDNCDEDVLVTFNQTGTQDGCYYSLIRTWTATDDCGNSVSASQTIVVGDNTDPWIVAAPAEEIWVECDQQVPALEVLFDDNCDENLTLTAISTISAPLECGYDISRGITATDDCGNSISFGQVVHVRDTQDPMIDWVAESVTIDCEDEIPAPVDPIFSDLCDDSLEVLPASSIVQLECGYEIHRTWTATDDCGNSTTAVQNIYVIDTEAPVIDPYVIYQHVECEDSFEFTGITATDNCGDVHITFTDDNFSGGCPGVIVRTYTVTDDCGNEAIAQQIISLQDTHGPVIENPADATVDCQDAPTSMPEINIYDHCSEATVLEATQEIVIIDACTYQIIWHWEAIDYCENISEATTVITVTDNTAPVISNLPESMTFECNESFDAPTWPTITDNCMETPFVEYSVDTMQGDCPYNFDVYYTWRTWDNCENETVESVVYHVRDTQGPEFGENQSEFSFECDEEITLVQPEATDNCGTVSYEHHESNYWTQGCNSGFSRIWTATDECGNSSYFTQYISIYDETAPVVSGEFEITLLCDEFEGIYITAIDNCNIVTIDHVDEEVSGSCAGRYIRTYTVSDACGNSVDFIQLINLIDETNPTVEVPAVDIQVECGDEIPAFEPVFADNCDDSLTITMISAIAYSEDGCTTYISQGWTATDDCNNSVSTGRTITITDSTDPVFDTTPQDEYYTCNVTIPVADVTASDVCDEDVMVDHVDVIIPGSCPSNYTIERTWSAEDNCGNVAEYVQHIFIIDEDFPVFTYVPGPSEFSCEDEIVFGSPIAEDNCSDVTYDHFDNYDYQCNNTYEIVRTWIATDACGHSTTAMSHYTIYDNVAPEFDQELTDVTVQCESDIPAPVEVTATDNCGQAYVSVEILEVESDTCGNQILYVQYTAHDDCDNTNYTGYYITVNDDTDPVLEGCPDDLVIGCTDEIPAPADVTVSDNCDQNITVSYEQFYFGSEPTEGSIADCNLTTPIRPAGNPCGYPYDWAMAMFGLPTQHRYYNVHNGSFVRFPNGTAHLTADLRNVQNAANGWHIDVWFANEMEWSDWSSQGFPTSFKADCGGVAANHFDWLYFILQAAPGAELEGFGGYAGSSLNLTHAPANHYFGFQLGDGANNYNAGDNGFGGWFSYNGYFQVNQVPFGNDNGTISGAGDLAFELDCCPNYHIIRQWTATDCSGNTSTCSQMISFGDTQDSNAGIVTQPGKLEKPSENEMIVNVAPNPTNDNTLFTFVTTSAGKTTLEIYDLSGKKTADVFIGEVEAGIEYKVNYNVNTLATGVYMYRLTNGDAKEIGRIIVNH